VDLVGFIIRIYPDARSSECHICCVDNKPTRCHFCVMLYFLLYKLLNMFRATMCTSSGADDWLVFSPRVGIVPWLQEGCQSRLVGSVSIEGFVAHSCPKHVEQLIKEKIKRYTKVTSSWFVIHTDLRCSVNHISAKCMLFLVCTKTVCSDLALWLAVLCQKMIRLSNFHLSTSA